jgi:hypothetical protein
LCLTLKQHTIYLGGVLPVLPVQVQVPMLVPVVAVPHE